MAPERLQLCAHVSPSLYRICGRRLTYIEKRETNASYELSDREKERKKGNLFFRYILYMCKLSSAPFSPSQHSSDFSNLFWSQIFLYILFHFWSGNDRHLSPPRARIETSSPQSTSQQQQQKRDGGEKSGPKRNENQWSRGINGLDWIPSSIRMTWSSPSTSGNSV